MENQDMQKELNKIEFALRQHKDKINKFDNPNFTIGYITSIIERVNNTLI